MVGVFLAGGTGASCAASDWVPGAGFRCLAVQPGPSGKPGFTLLAPDETGLNFTNLLTGDAYATNAVAHNGSGVAIGDVDGDGWPDLYFCALEGPNRLYHNLGNWRFQEIAPGEAACPDQHSTGAAFADVDGNGALDLLVNGIGTGTRLFLNDGQGRFTERRDAGLSRTASATSLALADIDGDGDLDLYCTHYIDVMHLADPTTRFALAKRDGRWVVTKVNDQPTTLPRWKDRFEALSDGSVRELPEYDGFYRNDGTGRFTPILFEPGLFLDEAGQPTPPAREWGLSVMFRDVNHDGAPDFYVCNDNASPDHFWLNTGRGTFRAAPRAWLRHTSRSSMGLDFADVNRDGLDDLFVLDMLAPDHVKRMTQLVRDRPKPEEIERGDTQPRFNRNALFLARDDGSFAEIALMAGVAATGWSWCPMFVDVDLDGFEDLVITTGFGMDVMDQDSHDEMRQKLRQMSVEERKRSRRLHPAWPTPTLAFRNRGDGTFERTNDWGFGRAGIANGAALGDLDNDGDLDLVVNQLNGAASLYRNNSPAPRIAVRLKGPAGNTQGIGARLELSGGAVTQSQEIIAGGRYMSGDQATRVFAAAAAPGKPLRLDVRWRHGAQTTLSNVEPNRIYEVQASEVGDGTAARPEPRPTELRPIGRPLGPLAMRDGHEPGRASLPASRTMVDEMAARPEPRPTADGRFMGDIAATLATEPFFADVTRLLGLGHVESFFDDWARQPLLARRLSRLGPGVSWYDVNGDGWDDLLVTAGRGGKLTVCLNEQGKGFRKLEGAEETSGDQTTVLGCADGRGGRHLLVGVSNYELGGPALSLIRTLTATNLAVTTTQPGAAGLASLGPMALGDVDGDGDLDLFVGGRCLPGRYPEASSSSLWLNDGGRLTRAEQWSRPFQGLGLVSGATFVDLDGDGDPDLALALDWGPVRIYRNDAGGFADITASSGLDRLTGWWTSVVAGDFNGDGRPDLVCGNWGRNSIYELYQPTSLRVYYGDWDDDGVVELIEAWQSDGRWLPIRDRAWLARGLPDLPTRFPTHRAFAEATIEQILPPGRANVPYLEATQLASTLFLNRGGRFEPVPLPLEAQTAPVFAINVADFDGDGFEDLFLGQNWFGSSSDLSRDDSGLGLWLRGTGQGGFEAVRSSRSGIRVLGEQRGAGVADFDHDGRVDLAVSQNGAEVRLYRNQGGKPGIRVTLRGPAANPDGVGALMRLRYDGDRWGPGRIVQAGSGYWSQDAASQVLGLAGAPMAVWIRWPGGREQTVPLTASNREVQVECPP